MKTLLIGDIHGRDTWRKIIKAEPQADKIIFIGDYFDSFTIPHIDQIHNFKQIINHKVNSDKQVILLLGNHE